MSVLSELSNESLRPLRRDEFDRLVAMGAFDDERVELLRGVIVAMSPQGPRHATVIETLNEALVLALAGRARVRPQLPYAAGEDSEPEPDLLVAARGPRDVHPEHALLVVEVSDSSLRKDRRVKVPIYAEAGVPEVWLVNLEDDVVEVYQDPRGSEYARKTTYGRGETLTVSAFPDVQIAVTTLLG